MGNVRKRWRRTLKAIGIGAGVFIVILALVQVVNRAPWSVTWDVWEVSTALGTVGATITALFLAFRSWVQNKGATARLVSTWVTDEYVPRSDGNSYLRNVYLFVANESNEPVFDATVNVHIRGGATPLGPLAAPATIGVIPPRRELVFDISVPMLAHRDNWDPRPSLTFVDAKGRWWHREISGEITDVTGERQKWSGEMGEQDEGQLGTAGWVFNPMAVALAFLGTLFGEAVKLEDVSGFFAPEAQGWSGVELSQLRGELNDFLPTSMVEYPAPRIARIKLSGDRTLEGKKVEGIGRPLGLRVYKYLTLTLNPQTGWSIYAIGGSLYPTEIFFDGSLNAEVDPYGYLPKDEEW